MARSYFSVCIVCRKLIGTFFFLLFFLLFYSKENYIFIIEKMTLRFNPQ